MSVLEKLVAPEMVMSAFRQMREHLFSKKMRQLVTGKAIEVYEGESTFEVDTAFIHLHFKAYLENIINKRISKALNFLNMGFSNKPEDYTFQVVINATLDYQNIRNFLNFHFANKKYPLLDDTVTLQLEDFVIREHHGKILADIPFWGRYSNRWLSIEGKGTVLLQGQVRYRSEKFLVHTEDLDFDIVTHNWIIKYINWRYHHILLDAIKDLLKIEVQEDLFLAKIAAQEQINNYQSQNSWVNGIINNLDLERYAVKNDGIHAIFVADGQLQILP